MATTTGIVESIYVNDTFCCINVDTGSTTSFIALWSYSTAGPTTDEQVLHNQWLALTRDGYLNSKTMNFATDDGSALALAVWIED